MSPAAFEHYKTNIEEIDNQHLDILIKACEIVRNKNIPANELSIEIQKLDVIFTEHLVFEEELMRKINYKYLQPHINSHQRLKNEFYKILDNLKNVSHNKMFIIQKLDKILLDHVDSDDRQYIEHYSKYMNSLVTE